MGRHFGLPTTGFLESDMKNFPRGLVFAVLFFAISLVFLGFFFGKRAAERDNALLSWRPEAFGAVEFDCDCKSFSLA